MSVITTILILAFTVEALIEYGKLIFQQKINWKQIVALLLGVLLAVAAQVDLYAIVGVSFIIPYVGMALTGIIFSRGANYVADFLKMIQGVGKKQTSLPDAGGDPEEYSFELTSEQRKVLLEADWPPEDKEDE